MSKVDRLINELKESDKDFEKEFINEKATLDIASIVFKLRNSLNLSQEEFAKKIEVPQSTISRIEQGKSSPTINFLNSMSIKLDMKMKLEFVDK